MMKRAISFLVMVVLLVTLISPAFSEPAKALVTLKGSWTVWNITHPYATSSKLTVQHNLGAIHPNPKPEPWVEIIFVRMDSVYDGKNPEYNITEYLIKVEENTGESPRKFEYDLFFDQLLPVHITIIQPGKSSYIPPVPIDTVPREPIKDYYLYPSSQSTHTITHYGYRNSDVWATQAWITNKVVSPEKTFTTYTFPENTGADARDGSIKRADNPGGPTMETHAILQCGKLTQHQVTIPKGSSSETIYLPNGYQYTDYGKFIAEEKPDWISITPTRNYGDVASVKFTASSTSAPRRSTVYISIQGVNHTGTTVTYRIAEVTVTQNGTVSAPEIINGDIIGGKIVLISCDMPEATIYYTTDGTNPTVSSKKYDGVFEINTVGTHNVKAIAVLYGNNSEIASSSIPISAVATPTANPSGGAVAFGTNVVLACATSDATICYTTDGTDPTESSTVYTTPITVDAATTIKAKAFIAGMTNSSTGTFAYTLMSKAATPTANPPGGELVPGTAVALSCATSGATIRYTTDGAEPTASSAVYSTPITISAATTIKAKAFISDMADSDTATFNYTTGVPADAFAFEVVNVSGYTGSTVTVPIKVVNNPGFNAVAFVLTYDPDVLEITGFTAAQPGLPRNDNSAPTTTPGRQIISLINAKDNYYGNDKILNVTFKVKSGAAPGKSNIGLAFTTAPIGYPSDVSGFDFTNAVTIDGSVNVTNVLYGDVNRSGAVTNADLTLMLQYFAGWDVDIDMVAADVNASGSVTNADLTLMLQYFAGWDVKFGPQ